VIPANYRINFPVTNATLFVNNIWPIINAQEPFILRRYSTTLIIMSASIGATHLTLGDTVEPCLKRADQALYQAKKNGRNQVIYKDSKSPI
jgi:PleD family two-component response regulator